MTTFRDILDMRGRIALFTPFADLGLRYEQMAARHHAQVIHTRGWADPYGPLLAWNRIHSAREYGLLSCDQVRYTTKPYNIPCTDVVWVGPRGDALVEVSLHQRHQATLRLGDEFTRHWCLKGEPT